ncbi:hypothetical protein HPB52_000560 [Rhipicephalus sanguineus]|uniref:Uncharacterized protein n=1 Tax=Rhipicephalus sanguineus TaxID=34632 RepID=A0A9D4T0P2_RHISA|nr:hypothetical protein HPB52_000560 [Rhipicephalus sanguineus]
MIDIPAQQHAFGAKAAAATKLCWFEDHETSDREVHLESLGLRKRSKETYALSGLCVTVGQQASSSALALNGASRSRLFSRDRLNTTDYMHTLATLDRRLAMDEILEKRRRAVFLQQIRCHAPGDEDDVFLEEGLFCPEPATSTSSSRHTPNNVDDTASTSRMQHGATSLL